MGHLINPINFRLNKSRVWNVNSSFYLNKSYFYLLNIDNEILSFLALLVQQNSYISAFIKELYLIFYKYIFIRFNNKVIILLFFFDFYKIFRQSYTNSYYLNNRIRNNNNLFFSLLYNESKKRLLYNKLKKKKLYIIKYINFIKFK